MAADYDVRLLSRAIRERNIAPLIERGVTEEWFFEEEQQSIWRFVLEHQAKYSECPTAVTVKDNFPGCRLLRVDDSLEYLLDVAAEARRHRLTIQMLQEAALVVEEENDHEGALALLRQGLATIEADSTTGSADVNLSDEGTIEEMLAHYKYLEEHQDEMVGIPTGFPTVDKATNGLQPGQLVCIIATPKSGKSTVVVKIADHVRASLSDKSVLVVSFEMTNSEQQDRTNAMRAQVSASRLRTGRLKPDEKRRLVRELRASRNMSDLWLTEDVASATVSGISAKIEKLKPQIVFIDGVYLMTDEITGEQNTPQALTNITRNLKRMAMRLQIPVVISTQVLAWKMQKKKVTADAIGYSSSFFQDSDVILGLERVLAADGEEDEMARILKVVESRNCPKVTATLLWDWETSRFEETGDYRLNEDDDDDD